MDLKYIQNIQLHWVSCVSCLQSFFRLACQTWWNMWRLWGLTKGFKLDIMEELVKIVKICRHSGSWWVIFKITLLWPMNWKIVAFKPLNMNHELSFWILHKGMHPTTMVKHKYINQFFCSTVCKITTEEQAVKDHPVVHKRAIKSYFSFNIAV